MTPSQVGDLGVMRNGVYSIDGIIIFISGFFYEFLKLQKLIEETFSLLFSTPPIQLLPGDFGHQLKRIMALV